MNRSMRRVIYTFLTLTTLLVMWAPGVLAQQNGVPVVAAEHLFDIQDDFTRPSDVSVGPDGRIFVLDGVNSRVKVFAPDGAALFAFGTKGSGSGQFDKPLGMTVSKDGRLYVADSGNRRIQVFGPRGEFLNAFFLAADRPDSPAEPTDVVVDDTRSRCYVIDNENHKILVYSKDGSQLIKQWGRRGEKPGEFMYPFLAALDGQSTLYVVDVLNTRVQAVNPEGRTMALIGKWGVDRGQFYRPKGVAVDRHDRIYVSDSYLGVIQVFKKYRTFKGILGDRDGSRLSFTTPVGIHVDENLRLYVIEMKANKVSVYQILEE